MGSWEKGAPLKVTRKNAWQRTKRNLSTIGRDCSKGLHGKVDRHSAAPGNLGLGGKESKNRAMNAKKRKQNGEGSGGIDPRGRVHDIKSKMIQIDDGH